jgi:hypothetical protein
MDICTNAYRAKSDEWGGVEILCKATGERLTIPRSRLPSTTALAMMTERAFDHLIAERIAS